MEYFIVLLTNVDKLPWILLGIVTALFVIFYKVQHAPNDFDLKEILIDPDAGNKVSISRFGQLIALIISSWGFVYLVLHNQLTEMYFIGYLTVWTGSTLLSKGIATFKEKTKEAK